MPVGVDLAGARTRLANCVTAVHVLRRRARMRYGEW
jgi:hypothetical protein